MPKKDVVFIVGAMAIGVAVSESPFLLYQDLMFKNSGFDSQSSAWTYGIRGDHTPDDPTTTVRVGKKGTN